MMLRYSLGKAAEAEMIETAVKKMLDDGVRTKDLRGEAGTKEVGDRVCKALEDMLKK
jgi:3-isopropylmalate dehydrogenase